MNEISFDYTASIRDNFACSFLAVSRSPSQIFINSLFPLAGIAILTLSVMRDALTVSDLMMSLFCIFFTPFLFAVIIALGRFQARGISRNQHFIINDAGVSVTGALAKIEVKWDAFKSASETSNHLILQYRTTGAVVLPKYILNGEGALSKLKGIISRNLGERANLS